MPIRKRDFTPTPTKMLKLPFYGDFNNIVKF